jgi:CheY-like chemotaxis protein
MVFVRQSGGQVRIYSEVGKGTTMCLYLPRVTGRADDVEMPEKLPVAETGRGETVLVIDDEPTVRMLMIEVLEEAGYLVIEAMDGSAGLKILQSDVRIDLLITDVGLPGSLNGRQVAEAARWSRSRGGRFHRLLFLACWGRGEDAKALFNRLLRLRNDVGLFSEQYDVKNNRLVGNFPQAFSHVALINTAHNLTRSSKPAEQRAGGSKPGN